MSPPDSGEVLQMTSDKAGFSIQFLFRELESIHSELSETRKKNGARNTGQAHGSTGRGAAQLKELGGRASKSLVFTAYARSAAPVNRHGHAAAVRLWKIIH
jgi:hypothetical protein